MKIVISRSPAQHYTEGLIHPTPYYEEYLIFSLFWSAQFNAESHVLAVRLILMAL